MAKVVNLFDFKAKKEESKENKDLDSQGDAWGRAIEPSKTPTLPVLDTTKYEKNKKRMTEEQKKHNEKVKKDYKIKP